MNRTSLLCCLSLMLCYNEAKRKLVLVHDDTFTISSISPQKVDLIGLSSIISIASLMDIDLLIYEISEQEILFGINWDSPDITGIISISRCFLCKQMSKFAMKLGLTILCVETTPCEDASFLPREIPLYSGMETRRFVCLIPEITAWLRSRMVKIPIRRQNTTETRNYRQEYVDCLQPDTVNQMLLNSPYGALPYTLKLESGRRYLNGRHMKIVTLHRPPFMILQLNGRSIVRYDGFCIDMLDVLAEKFNFTYTLELPYDNNWGNPLPNGTINGMVGMVHRQAVDFAVAGFTITQIRDTVIDFTNAFYEDPTTILLPAPKEESKLFAFMQPFTVLVWFAILSCVMLVSPLMFLLTSKFPYSKLLYPKRLHTQHSIFRFVHYVSACLISQAPRLRMTTPSRIVLGFWWMGCIILIYTYNSTLIAFLTVPNIEKMIGSLDELSKQRKTLWTYREGTAHDRLFGNAQGEGTYQKIGTLIKENPSLLVKTNEEGINKVFNEKMAFIKEKSFLDFAMEEDFLKTGECRFSQVKDTFFSAGFGWVLEEECVYLPLFNYEILRMMQTGFFQYWQRKFWPKPNKCTVGYSKTGKGLRALQLKNIVGHFIILGIGCFASIIVLLLELIVWSRLDKEKLPLAKRKDDEKIISLSSPYYLRWVLNRRASSLKVVQSTYPKMTRHARRKR